MIWEALKYTSSLLLLSFVMIIEQTVALPFLSFTLFVLFIKDQQPLVMILTVGLISFLGSVLFGISWLIIFTLLAISAQVARHWRQKLSRTWWGPGLVSLSLTTAFFVLGKFVPSTQFLVFSLINLLLSLVVLWSTEIHRKRLRR